MIICNSCQIVSSSFSLIPAGAAALAAASAAAVAAADLDSSVSEIEDHGGIEPEKPAITLCKCLYKLHFQLLLLFQRLLFEDK